MLELTDYLILLVLLKSPILVFVYYKLHRKYNNSKIDLIILCGGNELIQEDASKKNQLRLKQDKQIYEFAKKNDIPLIGICYGAQLIAKSYKCKISKITNHIGNHYVKTLDQKSQVIKSKKHFKVNSYHNNAITAYAKEIMPLAIANDNSIELFKVENKKILGMMWHPERFHKARKIDKDIFLNFYKQK